MNHIDQHDWYFEKPSEQHRANVFAAAAAEFAKQAAPTPSPRRRFLAPLPLGLLATAASVLGLMYRYRDQLVPAQSQDVVAELPPIEMSDDPTDADALNPQDLLLAGAEIDVLEDLAFLEALDDLEKWES